MNKWNVIQELKNLKFISENSELLKKLKKLALPIVVLLAVAIFWFGGAGSEDGVVVSSGDHGDDPAVADLDGSEADGEGAADEGAATDMDGYDGEGADQVIYVDLGGAVSVPGVYEVKAGTRLFQVIEQAGGLLDSADTDHINQAEAVTDGQKIIIGSTDINSPYYTGNLQSGGGTDVTGAAGNGYVGSPQTGQSAVTETEQGVIVNINLADESQLQLIPGVGPSTAQKILEYRQTYGGFSTIEDIKNISGIGDKTFENMKDFIIV